MNVSMPHSQSTELLCKPGEMLLKSKRVRTEFARQLIHNMKIALETDHPSSADAINIKREQGIFTIKTPDSSSRNTIRRVFGITSVSTVHRFESTNLDDIVNQGQRFFQSTVAGKRFAVRCKRSGETPFKSLDVARRLGAALLPHSAGVDLTNPDIVCRLDIHANITKFYTETLPAYGGLPIGTQGKAVALISGGIDSPVAAWYGLKRGLEVHYLFCCLGGPLQLWGPISTAGYLARHWSYGYRPKLYIADFNALLAEFKHSDHRFRNILLKRYIFRAADSLAQHIGADAIISGESLGQVSSQTLSNLSTISQVTRRLVLRPLVGLDKTEIVTMAREIGTLSISEKVPEFCNVAVSKPKTRSCADDLVMLENDIDPDIAAAACHAWRKHDLIRMDIPTEPEDVEMSHKPPGSWLIWITEPEAGRESPPETDQVVNMLELSAFFKSFNRSGIVLFACPHGKISRDAAMIAREKGLDAYQLNL